MSSTPNELTGAGSWATVSQQPFGVTAGGEAVDLFILSNARGMRVEISNYGATIVRWTAPDRDGAFADVVLGYDRLED